MNKLDEILKLYENNTLAHAYLISTNNVENVLSELISVIKKIYNDDSFNRLIDSSEFPNVYIIRPDGKFIKKDQIKELRYKFSLTSVFSPIKFFIILHAEAMNKEASNSLLKFLEEPTSGTYGFLITNDKYNMLSTITSRTESLNIYYDINNINEELGISSEKLTEYLDCIYDYLYSIEVKRESILNNKELLLKFNDRFDIINMLKIIFNMYLSVLNNKNTNLFLSKDYSFITSQNKSILLKKTELIKELLYNINYNVNLELLLDRFVLEMGVINNDGIRNNI